MDPSRLGTDEEVRAHMATLSDEALSDFLAEIDAAEIINTNKAISLGASAHWYATRLGWPVFPLKPRGKQPLTAHGFKDAVTDPATIADWWTRWPEANIGVPTGRTVAGGCGYDVIDVDGRLGLALLATLRHSHCPPDCTAQTFCDATGPLPPIHARAFTPGDPSEANHEPGRHLFTPAIGSGNTTSAMPGVDLRGDGGYVVVSPSIGPSGARYTWLTWPTP